VQPISGRNEPLAATPGAPGSVTSRPANTLWITVDPPKCLSGAEPGMFNSGSRTHFLAILIVPGARRILCRGRMFCRCIRGDDLDGIARTIADRFTARIALKLARASSVETVRASTRHSRARRRYFCALLWVTIRQPRVALHDRTQGEESRSRTRSRGRVQRPQSSSASRRTASARWVLARQSGEHPEGRFNTMPSRLGGSRRRHQLTQSA